MTIVQKGFTLLELLVTLAIMSIMLAITIVGFRSQMDTSQSTETSASLKMDLVFARGEAIKRGGWVGLCGTQNGSSCTDSHQQGWIVFHDVDNDSQYTGADTVIIWKQQEHTAVSVDITEVGPANAGPLMFNYRGYPNKSLQFDTSRGDASQSFVITRSGRIESQ